MAAAYAGIEEGQFLGCDRFFYEGECSVFGQHEVFQFFSQLAFWMALYPIPPQRVVYDVVHHPVCCKQLGSGRDVLPTHSAFVDVHHLVVLFRFIELIQPSNGQVRPILLRDVRHQMAQHAVRPEDVVGEEELGVAPHPFKHLGQSFVEGVALGEEEVAVEGLGLVLLQVLGHFLPVQPGQVQVEHVMEDLRLKGPAENTRTWEGR